MSFILASGSASRRAILENAQLSFEIDPADIDEGAVKDSFPGTPAALALELADRKALEVSKRRPGALVLGSDQVLEFEGQAYDKARSVEEAEARLRQLRGGVHYLQGGIALARDGEIVWRHQATSTLVMRDFSDEFLAHYLENAGDILTKGVGCYAYEGLGAQLFERTEGDYFAILGLSLLPVLEALRREGVAAR